MFFFFFSSRRRHTRLQGDWSSDVCSSDLADPTRTQRTTARTTVRAEGNTVRTGKNVVYMPAGTSATPRLTPPAGGQAPAEARISSDTESLLRATTRAGASDRVAPGSAG